MKKELGTRAFQKAHESLAAYTDGTVDELYTVAEISDIFEAWRNNLTSEYPVNYPDIPDQTDSQLAHSFVTASKLFKGNQCEICDVCHHLFQFGFSLFQGSEAYCSDDCMLDAGYKYEHIKQCCAGEMPDSFYGPVNKSDEDPVLQNIN